MIKDKTVLAVIPARSGSKRCPGKNFRDFRGKKLWEWSMQAAQGSKYIDKIILSLDENRPPELCTDEASNEDVLRHVLGHHPHDWIVLLQPTSPLRTAEDIDACIERAQLGECCISYRRDGTKNGAVYVCTAEFLKDHDFDHFAHMRHVMPDERSLDIDYPEQFK